MTDTALDRAMLDRAALAGLRGLGLVEPNPMVGCVIADARGRVIGVGHHRRFGGAHAEIEALRACARAGADPRGGTAWVTLEPCNHTGKTGPCTDALLDAGIARVVIARSDDYAPAAGGADRLRIAGVKVRFTDASPLASWIGEPFLHAVRTGRPLVVAKWAQTLDGRMATAAGDSKWISNERSRRRVHRLRGMVDAVLVGIGTVLADDPLLTCRGVPARRVARRVVIDPRLETPLGSRLVATARDVPLTILTRPGSVSRAGPYERSGAEVVGAPIVGEGLDLESSLRWLRAERAVSTALVEAGPRLLGRFIVHDLVDEALVFVAPKILGDPRALGPDRAGAAPSLDTAARFTLRRAKRIGDDVMLHYGRVSGAHLPVGAP